jgi:hypothetical protein
MDLKIPLSFKQSEKNMYDFLKSQLSPSIYLKQLLKNEMEKREPVKEIKRDFLNF